MNNDTEMEMGRVNLEHITNNVEEDPNKIKRLKQLRNFFVESYENRQYHVTNAYDWGVILSMWVEIVKMEKEFSLTGNLFPTFEVNKYIDELNELRNIDDSHRDNNKQVTRICILLEYLYQKELYSSLNDGEKQLKKSLSSRKCYLDNWYGTGDNDICGDIYKKIIIGKKLHQLQLIKGGLFPFSFPLYAESFKDVVIDAFPPKSSPPSSLEGISKPTAVLGDNNYRKLKAPLTEVMREPMEEKEQEEEWFGKVDNEFYKPFEERSSSGGFFLNLSSLKTPILERFHQRKVTVPRALKMREGATRRKGFVRAKKGSKRKKGYKTKKKRKRIRSLSK
jgi:hypothetical protein